MLCVTNRNRVANPLANGSIQSYLLWRSRITFASIVHWHQRLRTLMNRHHMELICNTEYSTNRCERGWTLNGLPKVLKSILTCNCLYQCIDWKCSVSRCLCSRKIFGQVLCHSWSSSYTDVIVMSSKYTIGLHCVLMSVSFTFLAVDLDKVNSDNDD